MSVLTKDKILEEIEKGRVKIEPLNIDSIGPGSIDLALGDTFRVFKRQNEIFPIKDSSDFKKITETIKAEEAKPILLKPGETILGITVEKLTLPSDLCAWIEGRSRFARVGLGIHVTAGFIQPGTSNNQVLEISNLGPTSFSLTPGIKICQIILERCEGEAIYQGKFKHQKAP